MREKKKGKNEKKRASGLKAMEACERSCWTHGFSQFLEGEAITLVNGVRGYWPFEWGCEPRTNLDRWQSKSCSGTEYSDATVCTINFAPPQFADVKI